MLIPLLTAIHVATVVLWIGGVAFVTIIIFPLLLRIEDPVQKIMLFQRVENKFARHARIYAWTAGISGFLLLYLTGIHTLLFTRRGIGVLLMIVVWIIYTFILTFERRVFEIVFKKTDRPDTARIFRRMGIFHWFILIMSLLAVFFGVFSGHGGT